MKELEATIKERVTLHTLVSSLYDVQKLRMAMAARFESRLQSYEYGGFVDDLLKLEKGIKRDMTARAKKYPISEWIVAQRGLGYDLAGQLIGLIQGIENYATVSDLWANFGLARKPWCFRCNRPYYMPYERPARVSKLTQRLKDQNDKKVVKVRKDCQAEAEEMICFCDSPVIQEVNQVHHKGILSDWNPQAKALAYKISVQFIKQGDKKTYRGFYEEKRTYYENRPDLKAEIEARKGKVVKGKDSEGKTIPTETKGTGRIYNMARRYAVKIFLEHLWTVWRQLEGLSRPEPWAVAHGGHGHYIPAPPPYVRWKDGQSYFVYDSDKTLLPTESESEEVSSGSHLSNETHGASASQDKSETHSAVASHLVPETLGAGASHRLDETPRTNASQERDETLGVVASRPNDETQITVASQKYVETHANRASHSRSKGEKDKGAIPETAPKSKGTFGGDEPYGDSPRAQAGGSA